MLRTMFRTMLRRHVGPAADGMDRVVHLEPADLPNA